MHAPAVAAACLRHAAMARSVALVSCPCNSTEHCTITVQAWLTKGASAQELAQLQALNGAKPAGRKAKRGVGLSACHATKHTPASPEHPHHPASPLVGPRAETPEQACPAPQAELTARAATGSA